MTRTFEPEQGRVCVVGSFMMDLVVRAPRRPHPGETLVGHSFSRFLGGKGFNQAVAARRAGAEVSFIGVLGSDEYGHEFRAAMDREGIDAQFVSQSASCGTGVGLPVVEDSGENSIIIVPQANQTATPRHVMAGAESIAAADILLLQLELPISTALEAAHLAHVHGTRVILNPAPYQSLPSELLALTDVFIPNRGEAQAALGLATDDSSLLAAAMAGFVHGDFVLTLGADGAIVGSAGAEPLHLAAIAATDAIDTVGAGDTFCGTFAATLASGGTLTEAAIRANAAAGLAVGRRGSSEAAPSAREVDELLARG